MITTNSPEVLAPVGGDEQLKAAVRSGADAVYLGTSDFNARRNAENFDTLSLIESVKYCHSYGVKVYVTLNTLIFDRELSALYNTIKEVAESGADAVIVQDFAVIDAVKKICPDLPLHGSTQMAIHNVSGAKALEELGFSRVVLAREMSLEEMKAVTKAVNIETEVFIHGAHCMSASGNCYISAMFGERSGNRGKCAQVCRLDWKSTSRDHALSLKDMSYLDSVKELASIGVSSLKIEGRMKRPEYVAAAVTDTKKALNGEYYNKEELRSVFSRSGFTDGYLKGNRNADMFGFRVKDDVTAAANVLKSFAELFRSEHPVTPVKMNFTLKKGRKAMLAFTTGDYTVTAMGEEGQEPLKEPLSQELCERNLKKLGGTPFIFEKLTFENKDGLTLPLSAINAMRRECAEKLIEKMTVINRTVHKLTVSDYSAYQPQNRALRVRFEKFSQYSDRFRNAELISFPIDEILENAEKIKDIPTKISAELPELLYPGEEKALTEKSTKIKDLGITDVTLGNLGELYLSKSLGFTLHGNHGLNITNTVALENYEKLGLTDTILSFELSEESIRSLGGNLKRGNYIYGNLPLMLFRVCPQRSEKGCGNCSGVSTLTDRKNVEFTLLCRNKKYSVLFNSVPLYVGDKERMNTDFDVLYFTTEDAAKCKAVLEAVSENKSIKGNKTSGIYYRELS